METEKEPSTTRINEKRNNHTNKVASWSWYYEEDYRFTLLKLTAVHVGRRETSYALF